MLKNISFFVAPRPFARHHPGEIVTARVLNPIQCCGRTNGKARPAILLERDGAGWIIMGLTTRSHFANGTPRTPVPNPASCGLGTRDSYLWGRPTWVSLLDIGDHIGYADDGLLALTSSLH